MIFCHKLCQPSLTTCISVSPQYCESNLTGTSLCCMILFFVVWSFDFFKRLLYSVVQKWYLISLTSFNQPFCWLVIYCFSDHLFCYIYNPKSRITDKPKNTNYLSLILSQVLLNTILYCTIYYLFAKQRLWTNEALF